MIKEQVSRATASDTGNVDTIRTAETKRENALASEIPMEKKENKKSKS